MQISAKSLAALNMPGACRRCFVLRSRLKSMPFNIWPSVFTHIDRFSHSLLYNTFSEHGLPEWLQRLSLIEPLPVPHWSRLKHRDPETDITLTGVPDAMFRRDDGTTGIGDFKCAKCTAGQDRLAPLYEAQMAGYSYLVERVGYPRVTWVGLIYTEPVTDLSGASLARMLHADGFQMRFVSRIVEIKTHPDKLVPDLLRRARDILDGPFPRAATACRDCELLARLLKALPKAARP